MIIWIQLGQGIGCSWIGEVNNNCGGVGSKRKKLLVGI
jgi:hypothetical protein